MEGEYTSRAEPEMGGDWGVFRKSGGSQVCKFTFLHGAKCKFYKIAARLVRCWQIKLNPAKLDAVGLDNA